MRKSIRKFRNAFGVTGYALDTLELFKIFGGPVMYASIVNGFLRFYQETPIYLLILIGIAIFLPAVYGIRKKVLNAKKIIVPNKNKLIRALADYELQAQNIYRFGVKYQPTYKNADDKLQKEHVVSGLVKQLDNPIHILTVWTSCMISLKNIGVIEKKMFLDDLTFVGRLRSNSEKALDYVRTISR